MIEHDEIKKMMRQRYPFLLVDRVLELDEKHIVAIKNVTGTDRTIEGHFPDEAILPGVILVEAMAQTGGLLVGFLRSGLPSERAYLAKVNNVKFRQFIRPGDQVIMRCEQVHLAGPLARATIHAYVNQVEVCSGEVTYTTGERISHAPAEVINQSITEEISR